MNNWAKLRTGKPCVEGNAIKLLLVIAAALAGSYIAGRVTLLLLPFLIGLMLAAMLDRPMCFMKNRLHISRPFGATLSVVFVAVVICGILGVLLFALYVEVRGILVQLPQFYTEFTQILQKMIDYVSTEYEWVTPELLEEFEALVMKLRDAVFSLINRISRGVWNTAISVPQMFIGFMMMFFSTFFFLRDGERMREYIRRQIPSGWMDNMRRARLDLFLSLFGYIRAILFLAALTFVELIIGFSVLGVSYGIVIAFICAVLDALPAIGTGWVLTPWAAVCLAMGNYRMSVALLVLYGITWIVRQLLEPRVVGGQINMHPLVLLFAMYLGMQFFGVTGLLTGPLTAIVLRSILRLYCAGRSLREVLYAGMDIIPEACAQEQASAPEPSKGKIKQKNTRAGKNV